jgi:hypothetical protein
MTPSGQQEIVHPELTRRSQYSYMFTAKHHGGGSLHVDACWSPQVSRDEEFSVFDGADFHEITGADGSLYGVLRANEEGLRFLGTWNQQLAEFPFAREGVAWHGYPLYPLKDLGPENRRGEKLRPPREVFQLMERAGLITKRERKRLFKGDHV